MSYIANYILSSSSSPTLVVPSKSDPLSPPLLIDLSSKRPVVEKSTLFGLDAVSVGLSASSGSSAPHKKKNRGKHLTPLATDGQPISAFFNEVAARPFPHFGSLENKIRTVNIFTVSAFLTTSTTVFTAAAAYISLAQFPNYTEYSQVFDQYKIDQVEVWLEPVGSQENGTGILTTAVDLDDANVPTSATAIYDKQDALTGNGIQGRYHRWVPHMATAVFSGTFTSYGNERAGWIDSASPNVQHYGFKVASSASSTVYSYNLTVRAVISYRATGL
jgi:hypothetical protein